MPPQALSTWPITLGGQKLSITADPTQADKEAAAGYTGSFETQESDRRLERRDVTVIIGGSLRRGMGFIRARHDGEDVSAGYAWGEDFCGWFDDGGRPAGRRQSYSLAGLSDTGSALSGSRFWHTAEFDGHLWWATDQGCLIRVPNGDPTQTPVYDPALGAFGSATESLRANYNAFRFQPFDDNAGVSCLYLGASQPGVGSRMYEKTTGGAWAESAAFASVRLERFATVWWQDEIGVGADRLIVRSSPTNEIRYLTKGDDPMLEASYTTPTKIGGSRSQIQELIAAPQRVLVLKTDGLYDVTPFRAPLLTPYMAESVALNTHAATLIGRVPGMIYDDHVYFGRGMGVSRYDLRFEGAQQRINGECAPWAYAHDGFPIRGWPTAFAEHDGWLLLAIWNPDNQSSYVVRGKDRRALGIDVPNPMVWHGAEVGPISGRMITTMHVGSPHVTVGTALQSIKRYLWLGLLSTAGGQPTIDYVELPAAGGPLSQTISGGSFTHNPTARLYHTGQTWDDSNALKAVRRYDHEGAKASASNKIDLYMRADGDPAAVSGYTLEGTIDAASEKILPATVKSGRFIQTRLDWTTASPYTTAAQSYELRARAKVIRETFQVRYLWVVLERDYELPLGTEDLQDQDAVFDAIAAFQDTAQQAFVDESGRTYQVLVEQGIAFTRAYVDDHQWRTLARLELSLVSGPT